MARIQLTGKYGTFIGAYVLYLIINNIVSMIINVSTGVSSFSLALYGEMPFKSIPQFILYFVISLIFSLILSVMLLGFNKMFLDGSRGYPVQFGDLFYGFRHHPDRVILMQLLQSVILLLCCLPGFAIIIYGALPDKPLSILFSGLVLFIVGLVFCVIFSLSFSQSMYLMADYDDLGPVQALKESRRLMAGNKGRLFYLQLSFLGVVLLCMLTCNLGMLWAFPYMNMTYTNFYRSLGNEI